MAGRADTRLPSDASIAAAHTSRRPRGLLDMVLGGMFRIARNVFKARWAGASSVWGSPSKVPTPLCSLASLGSFATGKCNQNVLHEDLAGVRIHAHYVVTEKRLSAVRSKRACMVTLLVHEPRTSQLRATACSCQSTTADNDLNLHALEPKAVSLCSLQVLEHRRRLQITRMGHKRIYAYIWHYCQGLVARQHTPRHCMHTPRSKERLVKGTACVNFRLTLAIATWYPYTASAR